MPWIYEKIIKVHQTAKIKNFFKIFPYPEENSVENVNNIGMEYYHVTRQLNIMYLR